MLEPLRNYFKQFEEGQDKVDEDKITPPVYKARNVRPKIQEKHIKVFGCRDHGEEVYCHGKEGKGNMRFYIFSNKMGAYNKPTPMEIQVIEWDETYNVHPVWHNKSNFKIKDITIGNNGDYPSLKPMKTVQKRKNLDDQIEFSFLIGESIDFELARKKFDEDSKNNENVRLLKKKFARDWD